MLWRRSRHEYWRRQDEAVEMPVCGKPGKRWYCFPPFPQTLKIDEADFHIPTATTTTRMSMILKTRPVKRYAF
jgi:hypothetical protein